MENRWKEIWNRHNAVLSGDEEFKALVMELKKANGFDVVDKGDGIRFESWMKHIQMTKAILGDGVDSVYEVGCGSGANLVMLQHLGITKVGGVDYSENLIITAAQATSSEDIICGEAASFPTEPTYGAVISDSVSQYFPSLDYANTAFARMVLKAEKVIAVLDVHDAEKKTEWQQHRKSVIENYDEKYSGLDDSKLFIDRSYFRGFATDHDLGIKFFDTEIDGYWNGRYTYNVFMFK